jgi:hypothetical protein
MLEQSKSVDLATGAKKPAIDLATGGTDWRADV